MSRKQAWKAFREDIRRCRADPWVSQRFWWLTESSMWAVAAYRGGNALRETVGERARPIVTVYELLVMTLVQILTGIELPLDARVGPGLRIFHGNGLVVSGGAVIGRNCSLRHGVTIGTAREGGGSPTLGDGVDIGAHAQVLGEIQIGDGAVVGAGAVVLCDIPARSTAVGVPARVLSTEAAN